MRPADSVVGHALHAMGAALELEHRIGAVALDREHRLLDAAAVVRRRLELLDLEPAPLRVALQHPLQLVRPERGLVAADALPHLDDHVLVVGRIALRERELQLLFEPRDLGLVVADHLGELGVAARGREVRLRLPPVPARARTGLRAASGAGRPPPPRGGRCRRRDRTCDPASRCRSVRAPRSGRRVRPQPRTVATRRGRLRASRPGCRRAPSRPGSSPWRPRPPR